MIRLQSIVYRGLERRRQVEVGFLDTDKVQKIERDKVEKFSPFWLKVQQQSIEEL